MSRPLTKRNRIINWNGFERKLGDVMDELHVCPNVVYTRLSRGWSVERALLKPLAKVTPRLLRKKKCKTTPEDSLAELFRKFISSERMRSYRTVGKIYHRLQQEGIMQVA